MCVVGGGPAGLVLGLLLARSGLRVTVLEKHRDFLRDFRGDTIHPSTLDLLVDLGLRERLAAIPHTEVETLDAVVGGVRFRAADVRGAGRSGQVWLMPQWDLLDLLAETARAYPSFTLHVETEAVDLLREDGRVTGVVVRGPEGERIIHAGLVVGADGRGSRVREASGLRLVETGVPIDVLWFRVERPDETPPDTIGNIGRDVVVTIPRVGYFQTALLIPKGAFDAIRAAGIETFRRRVVDVVPFLGPMIGSVRGFEDVSLLDVRIAYAPRWHAPGLLLIGDAAHPMSPVFGVGINYAIQDAVATARALVRAGTSDVDEDVLAAVQRRRFWPVRAMQRLQQVAHRGLGGGNGPRLPPPQVLRLLAAGPLKLVPPVLGHLVGTGLRPERLDF